MIKIRKLFFRKWHRRLGLFVSLFMLLLAGTGILLNHNEFFAFHEKKVQQLWLIDWYGVKQPEEIICSEIDGNSVCQVAEYVFHSKNNHMDILEDDARQFIGHITTENELYLVYSNRVAIYTNDFQLIEYLEIFQETGKIILAAGIKNDSLLLKTTEQYLILDLQSSKISKINHDDFLSQETSTVTAFSISNPIMMQRLSDTYRQQQISWLRLLRDLHSGQIIGIKGKLFNDLISVLLMLMAVSGLIVWQKSNR